MAVAVYLEVGAKRTFACAVDWPGWSRAGRSADEAIANLAAHAARYAKVATAAKAKFDATRDSTYRTVETLKGGSGTDFGVPSATLSMDGKPISPAELKRLIAILRASWAVFDRTAASAKGLTLRKGPRGGGRDLDKIIGHVNEADEAYIVALGARPPKPSGQMALLRDTIVDALEARVRGGPIANPSNAKKLWTPRYFVRRCAWHVLDHAWEIEDRAERT